METFLNIVLITLAICFLLWILAGFLKNMFLANIIKYQIVIFIKDLTKDICIGCLVILAIFVIYSIIFKYTH